MRPLVALGLVGTLAVGAAVIIGFPKAPTIVPGQRLGNDLSAQAVAVASERIALDPGGAGWAVVPDYPYWRVVRTADGGRSWRDVTPAGGTTTGGLDLSALGPRAAAVAYRPYQYARRSAFALTMDAGARWATGFLPGPAAGPGSMAVGGSGWFAVLGGGRLVISRTGGATWSTVRLPAPRAGCRATAVAFWTAARGLVGTTCTGRAALWTTATGGRRWQLVRLPVPVAPAERADTRPTPVGGGRPPVVVSLRRGGGRDRIAVVRLRGGRWERAGAIELAAGPLVTAASGRWVWAASPGWSPHGDLTAAVSGDGGATWRVETVPVPAPEATGVALTSRGSVVVVGEANDRPRLWTGAAVHGWQRTRLRVTSSRQPPYGQA